MDLLVAASSKDLESFLFNVRLEGDLVYFDLHERSTDTKLSWRIEDPANSSLIFKTVAQQLRKQARNTKGRFL